MKKWLIVVVVVMVLAVTVLPVSADGPPTHCPGGPSHTIPPGWAKPGPGAGADEILFAAVNEGGADHAGGQFPHTTPPGWAKGPK